MRCDSEKADLRKQNGAGEAAPFWFDGIDYKMEIKNGVNNNEQYKEQLIKPDENIDKLEGANNNLINQNITEEPEQIEEYEKSMENALCERHHVDNSM